MTVMNDKRLPSVVAVYNMKGGVGKTTTAVNLSYLAAAGGLRTLLWDLDPQAASSFAFRVRPRVDGFRKRSLEGGEAFADAIKETDYDNLHLLPADFAYRKLDRLLGRLGKPERIVKALIGTLGRDYDVVFLDCPAGFSLVIEGVVAAADAVLMPTIPSVFSLRTLARVIKWADRLDAPPDLAAFFSMVDRRKALHRRACEWSSGHRDVFLAGHIPYASVVEQMAVRRMPLGVFAPRDAATIAFAGIWAELLDRLQQPAVTRSRAGNVREQWEALQEHIEALIAQLELDEGPEPVAAEPRCEPEPGEGPWARYWRNLESASRSGSPPSAPAPATNGSDPTRASHEPLPAEGGGVHFVHDFDTERRGLQRGGYALELHERGGTFLVVAARNGGTEASGRTEVQIDKWWAMQILSGAMSPLSALERRLRPPVPPLLGEVRSIIGDRRLRRIDSHLAQERSETDAMDPQPLNGSARSEPTASR
jgi:cellulose biosynthesis protein BcsQ